MAEIVRRRSWGGVLPLGRHVSISGSSFIQCASASIAPPHPGGAKCYPGAEVQGRTGSSDFREIQSIREQTDMPEVIDLNTILRRLPYQGGSSRVSGC